MHIITRFSYRVSACIGSARELGSVVLRRGRPIDPSSVKTSEISCLFVLSRQYFRRSVCTSAKLSSPRNPDEGSVMSQPSKSPNKSAEANKFKVLGQETLHKEKWLSLERITYSDPTGRERTWEAVERTTKPTTEGAADAVVMVAILNRLLHYDCVVLVKQFRPPLKKYTIEFPAGLIDANEGIEEAALRELKEETGYTGSVLAVSPGTALDPGMSGSSVNFVHVQIDGNDKANSHPECHPDDGEFTEVLLIPVNEMLNRITDLAKEWNAIIDARVYMYAATLGQPRLGMVSPTVTNFNGS